MVPEELYEDKRTGPRTPEALQGKPLSVVGNTPAGMKSKRMGRKSQQRDGSPHWLLLYQNTGSAGQGQLTVSGIKQRQTYQFTAELHDRVPRSRKKKKYQKGEHEKSKRTPPPAVLYSAKKGVESLDNKIRQGNKDKITTKQRRKRRKKNREKITTMRKCWPGERTRVIDAPP